MRLFLCLAAICFLISFSFAEERNVIFRGQHNNSLIQFLGKKDDSAKSGRVAFMGGSITQMNGYRPMVSNWLKARFPQTKFEFINPEMVDAKGYGEEQPIVPNDSDTNKTLNRRIEVIVWD